MVIEKFNPKNLKNIKGSELELLTIEDISLLAKTYPHMDGVLLVQKKDGTGIKSPATYRSFHSLIKSGHPFKIVGTKYGEPVIKPVEVEAKAQDIAKVEYIAPPSSIFPNQQKAAKRGRKPKNLTNN